MFFCFFLPPIFDGNKHLITLGLWFDLWELVRWQVAIRGIGPFSVAQAVEAVASASPSAAPSLRSSLHQYQNTAHVKKILYPPEARFKRTGMFFLWTTCFVLSIWWKHDCFFGWLMGAAGQVWAIPKISSHPYLARPPAAVLAATGVSWWAEWMLRHTNIAPWPASNGWVFDHAMVDVQSYGKPMKKEPHKSHLPASQQQGGRKSLQKIWDFLAFDLQVASATPSKSPMDWTQFEAQILWTAKHSRRNTHTYLGHIRTLIIYLLYDIEFSNSTIWILSSIIAILYLFMAISEKKHVTKLQGRESGS